MRFYSGIVFLSMLLGLCHCKAPGGGGPGGKGGEKKFHHDGVYVKVLGQSGKIVVARSENVDGNPERVVIEMDELIERDADGNAIKGKKTKHSLKSFASQDFTFSEPAAGSVQGIYNTYFTFETQLKDLSSTLKVTVMIFKDNGTLTFDDEEQEVTTGMVKFNVELNHWSFCKGESDCSNKEGSMVDFVIAIKGKSDKFKERKGETREGGKRRGKEMELGGGAVLTLSSKVKAGNSWATMAEGYPKVEARGAKTMYTLRFTNTVGNTDGYFFYDPTIGYNGNGGQMSSLHLTAAVLCWILQITLKFVRG